VERDWLLCCNQQFFEIASSLFEGQPAVAAVGLSPVTSDAAALVGARRSLGDLPHSIHPDVHQ
jgi:hypothetical protein